MTHVKSLVPPYEVRDVVDHLQQELEWHRLQQSHVLAPTRKQRMRRILRSVGKRFGRLFRQVRRPLSRKD